MPREPGPREKALREQREATFEKNRKQQRDLLAGQVLLEALKDDIAVARQKRGKPRKAKKK